MNKFTSEREREARKERREERRNEANKKVEEEEEKEKVFVFIENPSYFKFLFERRGTLVSREDVVSKGCNVKYLKNRSEESRARRTADHRGKSRTPVLELFFVS